MVVDFIITIYMDRHDSNGGGLPSGDLLTAIEMLLDLLKEFKAKFSKAEYNLVQDGLGFVFIQVEN
jgi:Fe-Mn family superoxide dismutase